MRYSGMCERELRGRMGLDGVYRWIGFGVGSGRGRGWVPGFQLSKLPSSGVTHWYRDNTYGRREHQKRTRREVCTGRSWLGFQMGWTLNASEVSGKCDKCLFNEWRNSSASAAGMWNSTAALLTGFWVMSSLANILKAVRLYSHIRTKFHT